MRFAHVSDVHLGYPIYNKDGEVVGQREELYMELERVVDFLSLNPVDFLFITGDLFDHVPDRDELARVDMIFTRIPEVEIVYITGERDYSKAGAPIWDYNFVSGVHVLNRDVIDYLPFDKQGVDVYGVSQFNLYNESAPFCEVVVKNLDRINILLGHGGEVGISYFEPDDIMTASFDYVGMGHLHTFTAYEGKKIYFPGSLIGLTEGEDESAHGFIRGHIYKGTCDIKHISSENKYVKVTSQKTEIKEKSKEELRQEKSTLLRRIEECNSEIVKYEKIKEQYKNYTGVINTLTEEKRTAEYNYNVISHEDEWIDRRYNLKRLRAVLFTTMFPVIAFFLTLINLGMDNDTWDWFLIYYGIMIPVIAGVTYFVYTKTAPMRHRKFKALYPPENHNEYEKMLHMIRSQIQRLDEEIKQNIEKNKPIQTIDYKIGTIRRTREMALKNLDDINKKLL